ncbi:MAG: NfeD family protein [Halanaeroarchaeum sp.]
MASIFGQTLPLLVFAAGVGLLFLEALAPGAHFIVLGVALVVAGLLGLFVPSFATPVALAVLVTVTGAIALYAYRRLDLYQGSGSGTTRSSDDLTGARGHVIERVTERSGRVKLARGGFDPTYAARSLEGEISEGADVVVVDPGGGNVVTVEEITDVDEIDRELARHREATETDVE